MEKLLGDAKRLVQHLSNHDNSAGILISESANLQNKLIAMRQYKDDINKLNGIADHKPRSTFILGSKHENQRIQNLEEENRELSVSLAEHQSALELIMNKYREQVMFMMKPESFEINVTKKAEEINEIVSMKEKFAEMTQVMRKSAAIDDSAQNREIEFVRELQVENENLRELLEISKGKLTSDSPKQTPSMNSNIQPVPSEKGVMKTVESYMLPKEPSSMKTENSSAHVYEELKNHGTDDIFRPLPIDKLKKRYGIKTSNIFANMPPPFKLDAGENNVSNTNVPDKEHIQKLKQLFIAPGTINDESPFERLLTPLTYSSSNVDVEKDNSENCFRAIISDIKLLDSNVDMNEKIFDHANESHSLPSDKTSSFFRDITNASTKSKNDDVLSNISESSVIDYLDYIVDSAAQDDKESNTSDLYLADINSFKSDIHEQLSNDEDKCRFESSSHGSNENSDNELDALNFLDDVLDFETGFDESDDNDPTLTNHNSDEDGTDENIKDVSYSDDDHDNKTKLIVDNDENILSSDDMTHNVVVNDDDMSDTDSQTTYTDDIDQTLSDFDSFLDFNDDSNDDSD